MKNEVPCLPEQAPSKGEPPRCTASQQMRSYSPQWSSVLLAAGAISSPVQLTWTALHSGRRAKASSTSCLWRSQVHFARLSKV